MKIYKTSKLSKVITSGVSYIMILLGVFMVIIGYKELALMQWLSVVILIIGGVVIYRDLNNRKIEIYDEKIRVFPKGTVHHGWDELDWKDVESVSSEYFLFPESGILNLYPKNELDRKPFRVSIAGMPIDMVQAILSCLPKNIEVNLYPYLKRKLEGKQTFFYKDK